ncbi:MutT/NUDIX hydrolase [Pandoravirus neocaledonia]|uniref:Nudix hydrolase incomplete domain containing protein n=1 Tax=Pandoravirus neocaledonia TaxID=2107708 RepID=A0A2U7UBS6_9VIRU|nr:MutT/NUDIX hydrolase [Pandoravirus neocaledonia]AVK75918.1 Nudix hydrolase incomplete domain containing protein [Pandoravirus neocaledonia]
MSGHSPQQHPLRDRRELHAATTGASILCYAVAPHTGELFFLLGKESGGAADARLDCDLVCTWPSAPRRTTKEAADDGRPRSYRDTEGALCPPDDYDAAPYRHTRALCDTDRHLARDACSIGCDADDDDDSDGVYTSGDPTQDSASSQESDDDPLDEGDHFDGRPCRQDRPAHCAADARDNAVGGATDHAAFELCALSGTLTGEEQCGAAPPPLPSQRRARRTHRWCDFGGRIEPGETQEEAAAREFFEETLGVVCTDSCARSAHRDAAMGSVDVGAPSGLHGDVDRRALAADLVAGRYAFKVRTCLNHGADPAVPRRYHVTFVKRIPWTPSVVLQFARLRCELAAVARDARRHRAPVKQEEIERGMEGHPTATPLARARQDAIPEATVGVSGHRVAAKPIADNCHATNNQYVSDEPAARAALSPDGRVRDECIEKDYIQFWSVRRLRQALDNGGCFRREHLRPLFMPTIAVVLDVMAPRRVPRNVVPVAAFRDDVPWHPSTRLTLERVGGASVYTVRCKAPLRRAHYHAHAQPHGADACNHEDGAACECARGHHNDDKDDGNGNGNDNDDNTRCAASFGRDPPLLPEAPSQHCKPDTHCVLN